MTKINEKGISLVVLVITIIVLLILAGVSISILTGDNGILQKQITAVYQTRKQSAIEKVKLAVLASRNTNQKLDEEQLKENINQIEGVYKQIEDDIKNFPINLIVDNFHIEITEDGKVVFKENESQIEEEKIETFADDSKTSNGITVTVNKDGLVTINGKATSKLFVKISNGIEFYNNGNSFDSIINNNDIMIPSKMDIRQKVKIINRGISDTSKEVNFVFRASGNVALEQGKINLSTESLEKENQFTLDKNVYASYLFIEENTQFENTQIQVELFKAKGNDIEFGQVNDEKTYNDLTISTTKDGLININGKTNNKLFVKISNGISFYTSSNSFDSIIKNGKPIFQSGTTIKQNIKIINRGMTDTSKQVNFVFRATGNIALDQGKSNLVLEDQEKENQFTIEKDVYASYLYIDANSQFDNTQIQISFSKQ